MIEISFLQRTNEEYRKSQEERSDQEMERLKREGEKNQDLNQELQLDVSNLNKEIEGLREVLQSKDDGLRNEKLDHEARLKNLDESKSRNEQIEKLNKQIERMRRVIQSKDDDLKNEKLNCESLRLRLEDLEALTNHLAEMNIESKEIKRQRELEHKERELEGKIDEIIAENDQLHFLLSEQSEGLRQRNRMRGK